MAVEPIWITYAWEDDDEGDFSYLVNELAQAGIEAKYDKIALVPGQRLWEQIGEHILNGPYSAWAYLLTPASIGSEACREELAYALYRAMAGKGSDFPLIGLLHEVDIEDVPPPLKVRLCISLRDPNWREGVSAGMARRPRTPETAPTTKYVWNLHSTPSAGVRVEVRPRFGEIMYWRFAVPSGTPVEEYGFGPSGGGAISGASTNVVEGEGELNGVAMSWFGTGDRLSPGVSAFLVLAARAPWVAFGVASEPFGFPSEWEILTPT